MNYNYKELLNNLDYSISYFDGEFIVRSIEILKDELEKENAIIDLINKLEGIKYSVGYYHLPEEKKISINCIIYDAGRIILGCNKYLLDAYGIMTNRNGNVNLIIEKIKKTYSVKESESVVEYAERFTNFRTKENVYLLSTLIPSYSKILTK